MYILHTSCLIVNFSMQKNYSESCNELKLFSFLRKVVEHNYKQKNFKT